MTGLTIPGFMARMRLLIKKNPVVETTGEFDKK
jgi:hypothetical protein